MHIVAHLSDPHLDGTHEPRDRFLRTVRHLRRATRPIDAVVLTGDVVQGGAVAEYEVVADALADGPPAIVCPGNSDERSAFRTVLGVADGTADAPSTASSTSTGSGSSSSTASCRARSTASCVRSV